MTSNPSIESRRRGCLYGVAVGNALGLPYEGRFPGTYTPSGEMEVYEYRGRCCPPGTWSEDTTMTLWIAKTLAEINNQNWGDLLEKWLLFDDCGDYSVTRRKPELGKHTRESMLHYARCKQNGEPLHPNSWKGVAGDNGHGNGSIMRVAPIPVYFYQDIALAMIRSSESSRLTHPAQVCADGCRLLALYILGFIHCLGSTPAERKQQVLKPSFRLMSPAWNDVQVWNAINFQSPDIHRLWLDAPFLSPGFTSRMPPGTVQHTLATALAALHTTDTFEGGMRVLLRGGNDVDTLCSVYGQLAGACYGFDDIPPKWINKLQELKMLSTVFEQVISS